LNHRTHWIMIVGRWLHCGRVGSPHHCRAEKRNCFLHILVFQIRSTILLYWSRWYWERFRFTAWCSLICVEDNISNDEEASIFYADKRKPSQRCLSARNMKLVESCNDRMLVYINSLKLFVSSSPSSCWSFWDLIVLRFVWGMQLLNVQRYVPAFVLEGPLLFLEKKHVGTCMVATWPCLSLGFSSCIRAFKKNSIPPLKKATTKNTIPHHTSTQTNHAMLNHSNLFWIDYPP